jgi:hypothetical protein
MLLFNGPQLPGVVGAPALEAAKILVAGSVVDFAGFCCGDFNGG